MTNIIRQAMEKGFTDAQNFFGVPACPFRDKERQQAWSRGVEQFRAEQDHERREAAKQCAIGNHQFNSVATGCIKCGARRQP